MPRMTPERRQVLDVLADGCSHSANSIAAAIGKLPNTVNKQLLRLLDSGLVYQPSRGVYALLSSQQTTREAPRHAPRIHTDPGVYILRNGPYYKIGKSTNVAWRVCQLRTGLPNETVHVHTITTDQPDELERELHLKYAAKHHRGEWFELDMFDVDELCEMGAEFH